jgi:serine/threonine-protein kinase
MARALLRALRATACGPAGPAYNIRPMPELREQLQSSLEDMYQIERELGGGGMSRVFLAEERRLRRKVVVKVLEPTVAAEISTTRFEREIEFAAQLQHPQIVPLFSAGDAGGVPFYTMPFIDGESLGARLTRGAMPYREVIDVLRDVAKALAFAHTRGVVHRDIKPSNILLAHGSAVVTDFGIAKALAAAKRGERPEGDSPKDRSLAALTVVGTTIGTPAYMAPEQVAGDSDIDHRADIYALGCVAFEMVTGAPPFSASSLAALFAAHLTQRPVAVTERRSDTPPSLAKLIERCLEKEPSARPRSGAELIEALDRATAELSGTRSVHLATTSPKRVSVAVLPFKDLAADPANEHIGIGLADAAITELASVKALVVRPTSAILPYRNRAFDAVQAARELSVDAIVDGSFQRAGNRLRITVQLIESKDGGPLWGTKLTTSLDDVFVVQDEVSHRIVEALQVELTRSEKESLAKAAPVQADAYEHYLRGRLLLLTESLTEVNQAVEWFKKALEIDPSFARAYAGLADAYARIAFTWVPDADWYERAEEMCDRALAIDPQLPEGRYLRGRLIWTPKGGFDHAGAIREFTAAIAAQPNLNEAHHWLGIVLFHLSMFDESQRCLERALAIYPGDRIAHMHLGYCAYLGGRFDEGLRITEESGREVSSAWNLYSMAIAEIQLGSLESAEQTAQTASRRFPGDVLFYPVRALIAALRGDRDRAIQQIDLTIKNEKAFGHYHHAQYDVACVYAQLGEIDLSIQWLTDAAHNGFPCAGFFEHDPLLTPVRADERFGKLLASTWEECSRYAALYRELGG